MSNTPQPPADGWQPPQSPQEPPVYRPNEQPPTEEPPPWSPESQRVSPPSQQVPVEDVDGTVKYTDGPGSQPQAPFGPPPGVPVSPFDAPPMQQPAPPPGVPVSGTPVSSMPPVSGMPASGVPVSPGQGQFGPQGGQLVPVSGAAGQQPWGGAQPGQIQRKKKKGGGKGPLWILLGGIVVIAGALAVGGFFIFNPTGGGGDDEASATIESNEGGEEAQAPEPILVANEASGLTFVANEAWSESAEAPEGTFTDATGVAVEDNSSFAFVGVLDPAALGVDEDSSVTDAATGFDELIAQQLGGEISGEVAAADYRVDARPASFHTFTVGENTVLAAIIQTDEGYVGFAGIATADQVEAVTAMRSSLSFN